MLAQTSSEETAIATQPSLSGSVFRYSSYLVKSCNTASSFVTDGSAFCLATVPTLGKILMIRS